MKLDRRRGVESVMAEVFFLKPWVDVQAGSAHVEGARNVGDHTLPPLPNPIHTHPHVPVIALQQMVTGQFARGQFAQKFDFF